MFPEDKEEFSAAAASIASEVPTTLPVHNPSPSGRRVRPGMVASEESKEPLEDAPSAGGPEGDSTAGSNALESAEISNLFASMDELSPIAPGEVVRCLVLKVTDTEVIIDIGLKSEAALPRAEFLSADDTLAVKPGDHVDVLIETYDEEEGTVTASYQKAARLRVWEEIERAFRDQSNIPGQVIARTKGGLEVDVGVRAFLPASQADMRPLRNLDSLVGQQINCKVAKLDRKRSNVVVSRKAALEEEFNQRKGQLLAKLTEGAVLVGRVKNLVDYGAFVDLGGMDGLLHITDLSWGRISHPSEVVHVGQELTLKVLKNVPEKERVSLGLKQLTPDPWEQVASEYQPGDRITGRVVSVTDYGAFVELVAGIEGLVHISEMTWSKRLKHPSKIVNVGDSVEVAVLDVNPAQRRISLSLRQTLPDPWTTLSERLSVGGVVEGRVRNLTDFGAFVEIEEGVDGLIHLSDLSWTRKVKHPSEVLKKGQKIEAVILGLDPEHRRLSLGLKQLQPDIWETFFSKTQVGDVLRGKIVRIAPFGAFVELQEGIEGLCHISEMGEDHDAVGPRLAEVGRELRFRVIRLSPGEKRIGLSLNDVDQDVIPPEPGESESTPAPPPQAEAAAASSSTGAPTASTPDVKSGPNEPTVDSSLSLSKSLSNGQPSETAGRALNGLQE